MLLTGCFQLDALKIAATYAELIFDYKSQFSFGECIYFANPFYGNRLGVRHLFKSLVMINEGERDQELILSRLVSLRSEDVENLIINFKEKLDKERIEVFVNQIRLLPWNDSRLIQAYVKLEKFDTAESVGRLMFDLNAAGQTDNDIIKFSQALSFNGKIDEAIQLVKHHQSKGYTKANITELMRLNVLSGNYSESLELLSIADKLGIEIGDMHRRKAFFGNNLVGLALETFSEIPIKGTVKRYYKEKYYNAEKNEEIESLFLLAVFGPGDEIRFASIYNRIKEHVGVKSLSIACTDRLKTLFERSFKDVDFVSVRRPRNGDEINLQDYSRVPGSDMINVVDNAAVEAIAENDSVAFVTDFLHRILPTKQSFEGVSYLKADSKKVEYFSSLLAKNNILVGISWRSSLATSARNEHYLSVEQMKSIFNIPNVQFVNFQYDECSEEIEYINSLYPGKILDFKEVDHYNDFESVAALMSCMDLIISPATTVVELAGALGCKTWLFSNSSEIDWRKKDNQGTDIWHNSIEIIDVPQKGNKEMLVESLRERLVQFVDASANSSCVNGDK